MISEGKIDAWETTTLGRCGRWLSGGTPPKDRPDFWNGTVPWISAKSMNEMRLYDSDKCITPLGAENGTRFAPIGSILILVRGSMLHQRIPICIAARDVTFNQDVKAIVPAPNVLSEFLLYWLLSKESELLDMVEFTGIGAGKLSTDLLYNMKVELPSPNEQSAIIRILVSLDDKIELNRRMNETLEEIARTIFKSWFVDFDPVRAKVEGREPEGMDAETAALFPDSFEEPEGVPKGWWMGIVANLGEVVCGKTPPTSDPENYGKYMQFITIPDIHKKIFVTKTNKTLSHKGVKTQPNKTLPEQSICVSCIATPGLVSITTELSQTNQQINSVIPSSKDITFYSYYALRGLADEIKARGGGGSVITNLNTSQFSNLPVLIVAYELMSKYNEIVEPIFKKILDNERESFNLAAVRDALLPELLSGKISLNTNEKLVEVSR